VNPSLLVNFSPRTSLLLEADYTKDERTDFGAGIINYALVSFQGTVTQVFLGVQ
jgi:hypothetical protein